MDRFKIILISLVILVIFSSIVMSPKGESFDNYTRSYVIGRNGDTITVYGKTSILKRLIKMNSNWYLYGDTNAIVTNVEIIQQNVRPIGLVFSYDGETYEYKGDSLNIITNSK